MKTITSQSITTRQVLAAFWRGVRPERVAFFVSIFAFAILTAFQLVVPIYYKRFFDLLAGGGERLALAPQLISLLVAIVIWRGAIWFFFRGGIFIVNHFEASVMARLRQISFDYLINHSYSFFANNFTGSLVQRINRFSRAFEGLADILIFNLFPLAIQITGTIIVVWFSSPMIAYIILGWALVFIAFNYIFSLWKLKYDFRVAEADSRTTGVLSDAITNHHSVTSFGGAESESKFFKTVTTDQAKATRLAWDLSAVVDAVQGLLILIIEFLMFYYAVHYWQQGLLTLGTFVLFQIYILGLSERLWNFGKIIRNIYQGVADAKEMVEILTLPHEIKDLPTAGELKVTTGAVEFREVIFNFHQTRMVLDRINLQIRGGERVAIIGPSGAGKSTFVKLLLRLYDLTDGTILIDGQDIKQVTQISLRDQIALVPQEAVLFHRTLLENIRYGRKDATNEEVIIAARAAHCDEFVEAQPLNYETYVGERGIKLSGGERQRVAIARAILKNAPILVLDEATSSLDSHSEMLIQDALDQLMKGKTSIVIAHRLSTIRKMDRIIVIDEGRVREIGSHDELINLENGLYRKLWELQAGGFLRENF